MGESFVFVCLFFCFYFYFLFCFVFWKCTVYTEECLMNYEQKHLQATQENNMNNWIKIEYKCGQDTDSFNSKLVLKIH